MGNTELTQLREKLAEIADIRSAVSLLHWDQEVYMPPKASPGRGHQLATLSALAHRMFTAPEMGALLGGLRDASDSLNDDEAKLVSETLYDYERATKLPEAFVHEFAEASSQAFGVWGKARETSDFSLFQPNLERIVELLHRKTDYLGYEGSPYNALIEEFERGMTAEALTEIFGILAPKQSALVDRIANASHRPGTAWLDQEWDEDAQWNLSIAVLKEMGYDFDAGRQDKSVHPFTTGFDLYDVRITTRVSRDDLFSGLSSSIHEGGHALYEQGFRDEDRRTTLADAISLGIHESQSRMWENTIGRSLPFWKYYAPRLGEFFPGQLEGVSPEGLYAGANRVEPSLIRVEADECTYNLHIVLRFEIEVGILEGKIKVADIPEVWNAKVKEYLGLDVPNDALGCLQDIHWSHGAMGYFPTYALGNLYAAQLFETILRDVPDIWSQIESGQFGTLLRWLRENIHRVGRRQTAPELIRGITGRDLGCDAFLQYLEGKFAPLYRL